MAQSLKFSCGGFRATVSRDSVWQEWRVRFYSADGSRIQGADHHTDDKTDALETAQSEVKRMAKQAETEGAACAS